MRLLAMAMLVIVTSAANASAETCHERFVRIFTERNGPDAGPTKSLVIQAVKGQKPTRNYHYHIGPTHWMTEMIEPASMPWSLVHGDTMFATFDQGKSWKQIRKLSAAEQSPAGESPMKQYADTVKNAACGTAEIEGRTLETVEADYAIPAYGATYHEKFWIDPATGWISKSTTLTKQGAFESLTTQFIEKAPGLTLPTP